MPFAISMTLIAIGGAIIIGKAIYDFIGHDKGSSTKKPDEESGGDQIGQSYRGIPSQIETVIPHRTGFPEPYGSRGGNLYEQQRRPTPTIVSTARTGATHVQSTLLSVGNTSRTYGTIQGNAKRTLTYSSVVSPSAGSNSRYAPYAPPTQPTISSHDVRNSYSGSNNEVFSDVSNHVRVDFTAGQGRPAQHLTPRERDHQRKLELLQQVDLQVAFTRSVVHDVDGPGSEKRKAAKACLSQSKAAQTLAKFARVEHRMDDERLLKIISKEKARESKRIAAEASAEIFAHFNRPRSDSRGNEIRSRLCDLHGLRVPEARKVVKQFLKTCVEKALSDVKIVVGKGLHSQNGEAKLKPAILEFLEKRPDVEKAEIDKSNEGCILVHLKL